MSGDGGTISSFFFFGIVVIVDFGVGINVGLGVGNLLSFLGLVSLLTFLAFSSFLCLWVRFGVVSGPWVGLTVGFGVGVGCCSGLDFLGVNFGIFSWL